jgi:2-polyprenyl-3-methyl-5-hydroxy-6-metoxy-1,4-benzoquinol methylase
MENRFLCYNDEQMKQVNDFVIPISWWSRPYEYAFAAQFTDSKKTCIDAGCGIEHPFKYFLADHFKHVIALDIDERILKLNNPYNNLTFSLTNFCADSYDPKLLNSADIIFCISVIEHLHPEQQVQAFKNLVKFLKPNGKLVLTIDYPTAKPETIIEMLQQDFNVGSHKYEADNKANIVMPMHHLKVFTIVATKKKVTVSAKS